MRSRYAFLRLDSMRGDGLYSHFIERDDEFLTYFINHVIANTIVEETKYQKIKSNNRPNHKIEYLGE